MDPDIFALTRGSAPLLVSIPHAGTRIPPELERRMTPAALQRADVDWHLPQLYDFAQAMGATVLAANYARHVIDLNRPPHDESLYPGQDVTGLLPLDTFRKEPLYLPGEAPDDAERDQRRERYWQPYHDALRGELERLRARHGQVVLWDAHSICSVLPRFFEGRLPDLNLGTADGRSCAPAMQAAVERQMASQTVYDHVSNGRFKGGWITRHYGAPQQGIHALQLELCQCTYMDETAPFAYRTDLAARVQPLLQRMLAAALEARP
ncbi:N-formylglutamate deformylase [uncultured Piscinibacter sp.]|uniref:N-formylglutamate deformylase n=1 Tax=uncultured Piscinibacter sp. TaxID=1131835 RepID=UPI00260A43A7|nr:N-formylglutamate deformylase [uncultured Piscinibacter sp.]